jgi:hypothetical protein
MEASLTPANNKLSQSQFRPLTITHPSSMISVIGSSQRGSSPASLTTAPISSLMMTTPTTTTAAATTANVVDSRRHFSLSHSPSYSDSQFSSQSSQSTCSSFPPVVVNRPNKYYQTPEQRSHDNCETLSLIHRQQIAFDGTLKKELGLFSFCDSNKEHD